MSQFHRFYNNLIYVARLVVDLPGGMLISRIARPAVEISTTSRALLLERCEDRDITCGVGGGREDGRACVRQAVRAEGILCVPVHLNTSEDPERM